MLQLAGHATRRSALARPAIDRHPRQRRMHTVTVVSFNDPQTGPVKSATTQGVIMGARHMFDDTERQIREHCKDLKDDKRVDKCMRILQALREDYQQTEDGCQLAEDKERGLSSACQQLDNLQQLLHELSYSGSEALCTVLAIKLGVKNSVDESVVPSEDSDDGLEDVAFNAFDAADKAHRGALDKEQLLAALAEMGVHMSHAEVNRSLTALDAHGYVTYDTFFAILKSQALRSRHGDSDDESANSFLSGVPHSRPSWWSDAPKSLDSMW